MSCFIRIVLISSLIFSPLSISLAEEFVTDEAVKATQCLILSLAKDQSSISFYNVRDYLLGTRSGHSSMEILNYMRANDKYKDMLFDKPKLGELFLCIAAKNSHKAAQETVEEKGISCSEIDYSETINLVSESFQN